MKTFFSIDNLKYFIEIPKITDEKNKSYLEINLNQIYNTEIKPNSIKCI